MWRETYHGSTYSSEAIARNSCAYELSGLNRGLKTQNAFWTKTAQNSPSWTQVRTENFGYDPSLDYLTNADYTGDGQPNPVQSWSYDAAGNRNDAVCDGLNRAASIGTTTYTNDILGNRVTATPAGGQSTQTFGWDSLNRLTTVTWVNGPPDSSYAYRADGMRVNKTVNIASPGGNTTTSTQYRYDGQMGYEDLEFNNQAGLIKTTNYAIGARGLDAMTIWTSQGSQVLYPIYDAHGNMIETLARSGANYYTESNQRSFDAWGVVRQGAATGDPKGRYCAKLGHRQDDETGLVYMRARYYEPTTGRFISEDPSGQGSNWFLYADNHPNSEVDGTGKSATSDLLQFLGNCVVALGILMMGGTSFTNPNGAADYISEKVADGLIKLISQDPENKVRRFVEQMMPVLKLLKSMLAMKEVVEKASWCSGIVKEMGYNLILEGQMALTLAECDDPANSGEWWGYSA